MPTFTELLGCRNWVVRMNSIKTLGNIGPEAKSAVPALVALLGHKDEDVRKAAAEALEKIKKESKRGDGSK